MEIRKINQNKKYAVFICYTDRQKGDGLHLYIFETAQGLAALGKRKVIVFMPGHPRFAEKNLKEAYPDIEIEASRTKFPAYFLHLSIWLFKNRKNVDVLHAYGAFGALFTRFAAARMQVASFCTAYNPFGFFENFIYSKLKFTQEISTTESFLKLKNVNKQVAIVSPGINCDFFTEIPKSPVAGQFQVLYVGELKRGKGVALLLKAVKSLTESAQFIQSGRDFRLHIVGDGPEREDLIKYTMTNGLKNHVRFHGFKTQNALRELYRSVDLFVMPSRKASLSRCLLEAAASELPILASDFPDHRRVLMENVNGHLFHSGDVNELTYYLEHFALNPSLEQMGEKGLMLMRQEFTWEAAIERLNSLYSLMDKTAKPDFGSPKSLLTLPFVLRKENRYKEKIKMQTAIEMQFNVNLRFLREEDEHVEAFLERCTDFCANLGIPATFRPHKSLLTNYAEELRCLEESGHEIGVFGEITPSSDPLPRIEWRRLLPSIIERKMNLNYFLSMSPEECVKAVERFYLEQKKTGTKSALIFECDSWEFQSHNEFPHTGGENFQKLAERIVALKQKFDISFL